MPTVDLTGAVYPFDPTGTNPACKVKNEQHIITSNNWRDYHYIVPKLAPYFGDSIKLKYIDPEGTPRYLIKNKDWYEGHKFHDASLACAKAIYGSVCLLNTSLEGVILIEEYQTVGGGWTINETQIAKILADRLHNPRITSWEQVVERPIDFPVIDHEWDIFNLVNMEDVIIGLGKIEQQLFLSGQGGLNDHIANIDNPHKTTANHVGLGRVKNYPIATLEQSAEAMSNEAYMTPFNTRRLVNALVADAFNLHAANEGNPHKTTANQTGTYNYGQIDNLLNQKVDKNGVAFDTARFATMSPEEYKAYVLEGVAADSIKFNGMTFFELKQAIQGGASANAERFNGYTFDEATAIILAGQANSAKTFGGKTASEYAAFIQSGTSANATRLNNRTDVETRDWILAGESASTKTFGGVDALTFIANARNGTVSNSSMLENKTLAEVIADARNGLTNEAKLFGGKDPNAYRDWVLTHTAANADKFANRTLVEFMDYLATQPVGSASTVGGISAENIGSFYDAFSVRLLSANIDTNTLLTGIYRLTAGNTTGTLPSGEDGAGLLFVIREDIPASTNAQGGVIPAVIGNTVYQQYMNNSKDAPTIWVRSYSAGAWGNWQQLATAAALAQLKTDVESNAGGYLNKAGTGFTQNVTLTKTDFSSWGRFLNPNLTVTLADVATVTMGKQFTFIGGSVGGNVAAAAGQKIVTPNGTLIDSQVVAANTIVNLVSNGTEWQVMMYCDVGLRTDVETALSDMTTAITDITTQINS